MSDIERDEINRQRVIRLLKFSGLLLIIVILWYVFDIAKF